MEFRYLDIRYEPMRLSSIAGRPPYLIQSSRALYVLARAQFFLDTSMPPVLYVLGRAQFYLNTSMHVYEKGHKVKEIKFICHKI